MRTLEELRHTTELIEHMKDVGDFESARELFEQFVMDSMIEILDLLYRNATVTQNG